MNHIAHRTETNYQDSHHFFNLRRSLLSGVYVLKESTIALRVFRFEANMRNQVAGKLGNIIYGAETGYQFGSGGRGEDRVGRSSDQD
jgi:hypothetical protein